MTTRDTTPAPGVSGVCWTPSLLVQLKTCCHRSRCTRRAHSKQKDTGLAGRCLPTFGQSPPASPNGKPPEIDEAIGGTLSRTLSDELSDERSVLVTIRCRTEKRPHSLVHGLRMSLPAACPQAMNIQYKMLFGGRASLGESLVDPLDGIMADGPNLTRYMLPMTTQKAAMWVFVVLFLLF